MVYGKRLFIILCFVLLDIATGLLKAFSAEGYSSEKMRKGLWHKLAEIVAFLFCVLCDITFPQFEISLPFKMYNAVSVYIIFMEIGSVIENLGIMSPELGKYLSGIFEKVQPKEQDSDDDQKR